MQLSKVRAVFGLSGQGVGTRPGVSWHPVLGTVAVARRFADADMLYTVEMSDITAVQAPELNPGSGAIAANGATVSRTAAKDFEASVLPSAVSLHAILFERLDDDPEVMEIFRTTTGTVIWKLQPGEVLLAISANGKLGPGVEPGWVLQFGTESAPTTPAHIRVTVLASTS